MTTMKTTSELEISRLSLRARRGLSRAQAAAYLGIGPTLLGRIGPTPTRLGRRVVYDILDLDAWLDEHKGRGRAMKKKQWLEKEDCIDGKTQLTGGSTWSSPTDAEYARALGIGESAKQKST